MSCSCCCHRGPARDQLDSTMCEVPFWALEITWSDETTRIYEWGLRGPHGVRLGPFRDPNQAWEMAARIHLAGTG